MARSTTATAARKALVKQAEQQAGSRVRTKSRQDKPTLAVRISYHTNERLTPANEKTGLGVSGIVEAALVDYLDFLGIPADAEPPRNPDGSRPKRERTDKKRTRRTKEEIDEVSIGPRITRQTDNRLTIACLDTGTGPQDILETALKAWLRKQGIPLYPQTPGA
ncbi:hypothetical protein ACFLIM_38810 [Nonomuraea sp. M3C6]|uniref:Lsr2 protein n=1 Tax=Nonomuraea marmarensis TaxID=3351344 RepID=A0ABW7AP23_9ACTN